MEDNNIFYHVQKRQDTIICKILKILKQFVDHESQKQQINNERKKILRTKQTPIKHRQANILRKNLRSGETSTIKKQSISNKSNKINI